MSEEPLCWKCGLPMHKDDARRYFGFYAAHMEDRCGTLPLRGAQRRGLIEAITRPACVPSMPAIRAGSGCRGSPRRRRCVYGGRGAAALFAARTVS